MGFFEFNITRLSAYIGAVGRFRPELVAIDDIPHAGKGKISWLWSRRT
jgi:hypothetical protein